MKERPMLFNGAMVRAVLADQKTVTRRMVPKWQLPSQIQHAPGEDIESMRWISVAQRHPRWGFGVFGSTEEECMANYKTDYKSCCPYGEPGDRLWVRESWRVGKPHDKTKPVDILPPLLAKGKGVTVLYDAGGWKSIGPVDRDEPVYPDDEAMPSWAGKGRPSIHMPRDFCRILLEITAVRVERLQDISEEQARAEGITDGGCLNCGNHEPCGCDCPAPCAVDSFVHLWNSTGGDWAANPWVWVIEFKRIEVANADK